jgi:hypothetical protein
LDANSPITVSPSDAQVLREIADELDQNATDFSKIEVLRASDHYFVARVYSPLGDDFTAYHLRRQ